MVSVGRDKIANLYVGDMEYTKAYLGNTLVFDNSGEKFTVSVAVKPPSGGTVTGAGRYKLGETVTLKAVPNPGMEFVCWKDLDGPALPDGYIPLDYIESSGSQYINIGKFEPNYRITIDCEMANTTGNCFGTNVPFWYLLAIDSSLGLGVNLFASGFIVFDSDKTTPRRIKADINSATDQVTINGITKEVTTTYTKSALTGLTLFARSTGVNSSTGAITAANQYTNGMKLFSCRIYEDTEALIHDFIPCLNESNVAGLYDTVDGKFYGSNTATPMVAGDISNKDAEYSFEITSNRNFTALFCGRVGLGYKEVEYIEDPGGATLPTVGMGSALKMEIDVEPLEVPASGIYNYFVFAYSRSSLSGGRYQHRYLAVNYTPAYIGGEMDAGSSSSTNASWNFVKITENVTPRRMKITIDYPNERISVDDASLAGQYNSKNYVPNAIVQLLSGTFKAKLYSVKVINESTNEVVRDFVPCVNPDGVVGMLDIVGNLFIASSTATAFEAGPAV